MEIEKKRAFIIQTVYYLIFAVIVAVVVKFGLPLLAPFVTAFVIAYVLRGPTKYLRRRFKLPHKPVALLIVLLFYSTVGVLIGEISIWLFSAVRTLVEALPHLYTEHLEPALETAFLWFERMALRADESLFDLIQDYDDQFLQWMASFISSLSSRAVGAASSVAASIPGLFIKLVLMIISTFFIAADYEMMKKFVLRQIGPKNTALLMQVKRYVVGTLFVCIGSYLIIMSLTFVELSIGLSILGIKHGVLIAAAIAVFDVLPVLGTGGIMIPWAVICLLRGQFGLGLGLVIVYVIITVIRNVVEPKIVGSQLGLHPVVTLASMFVGVQLFGALGLFGFPIGLSLLRYLNDNGSIHVFKK